MTNFIFIYRANCSVVCLNADEARSKHEQYIESGYRHIATIDPIIFLNNLLNLNQEYWQGEIIQLLNIPE